MAAQLMEAAHQQLGATLRDALAEGDCAPLKEWLREHIWQHGRRYTRDELLIKARARI
jgi:carboxypeptidase Taq